VPHPPTIVHNLTCAVVLKRERVSKLIMLLPRKSRGGSSSGYSYSSYNDSPWNEEVTFSMYSVYGRRSYFYAQLAFEFLTLGVLFLFLFGCFFIKQPKALPKTLPKKALVFGILSYIL
jgi:hypothetical protein